tara:strand:+ start:584 stop:736 length:153 start_codon:yes stop_codon:yes gene_type:complete
VIAVVINASVVKLANTTDLKSVARLGLSVQVRPLVPFLAKVALIGRAVDL